MAASKYDFKGIKKLGATLIFTALASTPFAFLTNGLLGRVTFFLLERFTNWLANNGLILANVGIAFVKTNMEQSAFENAMAAALKEVKENEGKLSPAEIKAIDDKVIKTFDDFAVMV